jgi:hypothetical protein
MPGQVQASRALRGDGMPSRDKKTSSYIFEKQPHDSETDGRIFTCNFCKHQSCTTCDHPEHAGEACDKYQERIGIQYDADPIALHAKVDGKVSKSCPSCKSYFIIVDGCGYTTCSACQYRFCQRCLVPWVGEGSEYQLGREVYGTDLNGKLCRLPPLKSCPITPSRTASSKRRNWPSTMPQRRRGNNRRSVSVRLAASPSELQQSSRSRTRSELEHCSEKANGPDRRFGDPVVQQ